MTSNPYEHAVEALADAYEGDDYGGSPNHYRAKAIVYAILELAHQVERVADKVNDGVIAVAADTP